MNNTNTNYKQTEIGEIPSDWNILDFESLAKLRKDIYKPKKSKNLPYIGLEHINQEDLSISGFGSSADTISNKYKFGKNNILFGKLRPYFRKVYKSNLDGVCSTDIWVFEAKEKCFLDYLFYLVASKKFVGLATAGSTGTRMPRANWNQIKKTKWPIPEINEQKEIASILSSLDDKIELNRKMNQTLEEIGKTLFRQWFVDFEFPNDEGKPYKSSGGEMVDSELGEMPKGWEVKSLDEIATYLNGLACQKYPPKNEKDALRVIKIAELRKGFTESSDFASRKADYKYHVENGDVLFSWSGSLEVCLWPYGKGILNQHLFKVSSEKYPKWFYYLWTLHHLDEFRTIASGKATTMGHIQRKHLANAKALVPGKNALDSMSLTMTPVINKLVKNNYEVNKLQSLRDSLLPRLISGRIRV